MKRTWVWLLVSALILTLVTPLPAAAILPVNPPPGEQEAFDGVGFHFAGGGLTTSSLSAWGGADVDLAGVRFNADAGMELYFFGVDMSEINYDGLWGWPPAADDYGAAVQVGLTGGTSAGVGSRNSAWVSINSCGTHNTWNDGPKSNADGYRSYLFQDWYRGRSGGQVGAYPNFQYNAEMFMGPSGDDPECDTLDVYMRVVPVGGGAYQVFTWSRLHKSSARLEACPWEWNANQATGSAANNYGWVPAYDGPYMMTANNDFSDVTPYVGISNWGVAQVESHTVTWDELVVLGQPREVWVDDDYADGEDNDGHFWGEDAFDNIQDAVDTVSASGTVHVAAGTYQGGVVVDKAVTVVGPDGDEGPAIVGAGMVPGFASYQIGFYVTSPDVAIEGLALDGSTKENPGLGSQYGVLLEAGEAHLADLDISGFSFGIATVYGATVADCIIEGCTLSDIASSGIYFNPGAGDSRVSDCDIAAAWEGIVLDSSSGSSFESVVVTGATNGVAMYGSEGAASGNWFLDVSFVDVDQNAPTVTIVRPIAKSRYRPGDTATLEWELSAELAGLPADVQCRLPGEGWTGIANGVDDTTCEWPLPEEEASGVLIRVWAVYPDYNRFGATSGKFSIVAPEGGGGVSLPPEVAGSVSALITDDEGGSLDSADGGLTVAFGPGAVGGDATLTISSLTADAPPHAGMIRIDDLVYEITLEDGEGNQITSLTGPATLTFTYAGVDLGGVAPDDLCIFYYDEDLAAWVALPCTVDPITGTVTTTISHLTVYGLLYNEAMPHLADIAGHWAEADVLKLVSLGIVSGYEDDTFRPGDPVTREQFVKMVAEAAGLEPVTNPALPFADAGEVSSWAAGYVQAAYDAGIVRGMADNRFCPQLAVDRAQAAVIVVNALKLQVGTDATAFADDAAIPAWAKGAVAKAVELGIIVGFEDNTFRSGLALNRAQAAAMIARMVSVE